ncbi:hypothetical protein GCK32_001419 [Trichostrongylus colubriformis]|uniref:Uncharacterized protein n=1 Tax=Trichostrongylus colubriformis TaxID=6319 RepID=A0AAN8F2U7_TRICO
MEVDDSEVTEQRAEPRRDRLLADTDIAAICNQGGSADKLKARNSANPSFVRRGYGSQYEFNTSLLQKLSRLNRAGMRKEDDEIIQATVEMISVRNETLKIADKHPRVFSFVEGKKQAEAVKSSDPFLSESLEQVQKEERRIKKKRSLSPVPPSRPFPGRESAWRPDPRPKGYMPRSKTYVNLERPRYRSSFASGTPYQSSYTRSHLYWTALEPNILVLDTIINGYTIPLDAAPEPPPRVGNRESALENAGFVENTISELVANGSVEEVSNDDKIMIHPLSVAEDLDKRQSRAITTSVAEAQSRNIVLKTDNQAACWIHKAGSNMENLRKQAEEIC